MVTHMKVRCPYCETETEYNLSNPHRPFCSERCQLMDLGAWASETYRVPVESTADVQEELEEQTSEDKDSDSSVQH